MYRFFAFIALVVAANAGEHQATSFSSFNDNHNSVQHLDSAPAPNKYGASASHGYANPAFIKYAAPEVHAYAAPAVAKYAIPTVAKYATPVAHTYAAPAIQKYAVPIVAKYAVPAATSYHHAPQLNTVARFAPATPVTKYVTAPTYSAHQEEYAPAKYEFVYSVEDAHTGDFHSQQEHRDGDHVEGQYSLHEADGTVRIVKYSDDGHGFNAVVEKEGHPTEAPAIYKKVVAVAAPQYSQYHH